MIPLARTGGRHVAGSKAQNRLQKSWSATVPDHCSALAWSPDGNRLAVAAVSGPVHVFDAKGASVRELPGHGFGTVALDWHPSGQVLATAGQDGSARLWDPTTGAERAKLAGGAAWVEHLAWNRDGSILATAAGKKVRFWDAAGTQLREFAGHASTVAALAWEPRGNRLAVAAYGGVSLYEPSQDAPVRKLEWKGSPLALAWSSTGAYLAHGNQDATVHFWPLAEESPLQMSGYPTKVRELSWDASGRYLATGGGDRVCVWDCGGAGPAGTKPQMFEDDDSPLAAVAWQRRGFLIASASKTGRVNLWQPANKKSPQVGRDLGPGEASTLAWSPDDRTVAVGFADGTVTAWRVA